MNLTPSQTDTIETSNEVFGATKKFQMRRAFMFIRRQTLLRILFLVNCTGVQLLSVSTAFALQERGLENTQALTSPLIPPEKAVEMIHLPEGFQANLFASEPDVIQPISITTDFQGRIWVAECLTYAESKKNFDTEYDDRILIFEDTDGDGNPDKRKVFWSGGKRLTSIAVGMGGVWATCAPDLLFIPDRNGDDIPDGPAQVILNGWNADFVRHNLVNGLKWGPDGWLYGRHGIQATSLVGPPDASPSQRTALNCCMWRLHPVTREFEVICEGTTNPWGHDWDRHGELFMINTVIGHLWHVVPGVRFRRMYGSHFNPYTYEVVEQTADHFHFSGKEKWSEVNKIGISDETSKLGGGHAHCGMMIYQGDNWPEPYRDALFTANFHGRRLNCETLEREGNGYVGRHAADFMQTDDLWFRGVELMYGPAGRVYLLDWSDIGECHENDGIHRTSGRIYTIAYGTPKAKVDCNLESMDNRSLLELLDHQNKWYPRTARQLLQQRASQNKKQFEEINFEIDRRFHSLAMGQRKFSDPEDEVNFMLQTMWIKHAINYGSEETPRNSLHEILERMKNCQSLQNEHVRVWQLRLETDSPQSKFSREDFQRWLQIAESETSSLMRLYLASSMSRMNGTQRLQMASALSKFAEDADDRTQPKLLWYLLEPVIVAHSQKAIELAGSSSIPHLRRCIVRRLTAEIDDHPEFAEQILSWSSRSENASEILQAMIAALSGRQSVASPKNWEQVSQTLSLLESSEVNESLAFLGTIFGKGASLGELKAIAINGSNDPSVRRQAIKAIAESTPKDLFPFLKGQIRDRSVALQVVRSMKFCAEPQVANTILNAFATFDTETERAAISTLCARPQWAERLLVYVGSGRIPASMVSASHARQIKSMSRPKLDSLLSDHWGIIKETSADRAKTMEKVRKLMDRSDITPDFANGAKLFSKSCASCHVLYGEGGKRGPDLTGSDRKNLEYLLENVIDPSSSVADTYRSSVLLMEDGRTLIGVITEETESTLKLLMVEEETVVEISQIEDRRDTVKSLMPDGLLDKMTDQEMVDLFGYLGK